jgi:predicted signal transduction protein with EAL and GGDEF domain
VIHASYFLSSLQNTIIVIVIVIVIIMVLIMVILVIRFHKYCDDIAAL